MASSGGGDRSLVFANYVMMFLATFTLGLLAVFAVLIAYLRQGTGDELARSHYRFQIKSFWHDVGLVIVGAIAGFLALAGGVAAMLGLGGVQLPFGINFVLAGWMTIGLAVLWGLLWLYGFINLIFDSARGMMRLITGQSMAKTKPL